MQLQAKMSARWNSHWFRLAVVALLAVVGTMVATTGVAHANTSRVLRNAQTGRCLDDRPSERVTSASCDGTGYQVWIAHTIYSPVDDFSGYVTGLCLDDSVTYGLRVYGCNGQTYQQWRLTWHGGNAELKNINTGWCLDDSTAHGLRAIGCNSTAYQRWHL